MEVVELVGDMYCYAIFDCVCRFNLTYAILAAILTIKYDQCYTCSYFIR